MRIRVTASIVDYANDGRNVTTSTVITLRDEFVKSMPDIDRDEFIREQVQDAVLEIVEWDFHYLEDKKDEQ